MNGTLIAQIVTSGLVTGLIYMLIALGVTLLFGIMRVVNFVHGELVMLSAFAVYFLGSEAGLPFWLALCVAMAASAVVGVACQYLLFKRLHYEILNCFIVGIGASFAIRSASWAIFGPEPIAIPAVFPGVLKLGGVFIAKQRLFAAVLCVALAVALYLFLHFTRPGKAMRAVEQDPEAALLMGIKPESVYVSAFVISAMLAAVGGAMLGSLFGIDPEMGSEPLLKSFIIVQIGGMGSIAGTVIAGLFIGLSDSITGTLLGGELAFIIDFAILMIFLIVRPRGLFGYDVLSSKFAVAALVAVLAALPLVMRDAYFLHVAVVIAINVIMAASMWLLGITGLISFGQAGFMFIGAMTTALLTKNLGWPFWVAMPLSAAMAGLISAPVGRLSLRVKGVYFFLVTLAFGQVVSGVFAYFQDPFGGWYGIRDIPAPQPHWLFTTLNKMPFYYLGLALVVITCLIVYRVSRSWFGMVLWSIRENDLLATSAGIDVPRCKLVAFIVSAFFAGLAGSVYAGYFGYISPLVFTFEYSVNVLVYIVVGGFGSIAGPITGAVVLTLVPELFRVTGKYQMLAFGLILIFSMLLMPNGMVGAATGAWRRLTGQKEGG